jgi:hypothetical protein
VYVFDLVLLTYVTHLLLLTHRFAGAGATALATATKDMAAISSVNLLLNNIGVDQAKDLVGILKEHPTLKSLCGNKGNETELDMRGKMRGAGDAIMLVPEIVDNEALLFLNLADNNLGECTLPEGSKQEGIIAVANAIPDMGALSIVNVMGNRISKEILSKLQEIMRSKPNLISLCGIADDATEADLSGLGMSADDTIILASELPDKGALLVLDVSNCGIGNCDDLPSGWSLHLDSSAEYRYKHTDGRHQESAPDREKSTGAIAITNAIKDMEALSIANVMGNHIGKEILSKLQEIMRSKPDLISLCGIADDGTEADLSGLDMDADDAIILASELSDKRAMAVLNLANNRLGKLVLPEGWSESKGCAWLYGYTHTDGREQKEAPEGAKCEGIIALANVIPDMGAMTSLNLASNELGVEGAKAIAACLPKCT